MRKVLFFLLLIPSLVLAQSNIYLQNETIGTSGAYGGMVSCDGGTTAPLLQCDSSGYLYFVPYIATNATFAAVDVTGFADIGAAYASAVDLPDATRSVLLDNQTNGDVMVSMDGGVSDTFHLKGGDKLLINLAPSSRVTTADVQLKDGTTASTAGSFYISSYK